jgi:hypothetical protein
MLRMNYMARPIEATPVLKGKNARTFLAEIKIEKPVSNERVLWLKSLAQESKSVEK